MEQNEEQQKVKVYSTPTCAYCFSLKNFLKENNVEFEEIDIAADSKKREEMIQKSGQMEVPVIEIGEEVIAGFDREKIKKFLGI